MEAGKEQAWPPQPPDSARKPRAPQMSSSLTTCVLSQGPEKAALPLPVLSRGLERWGHRGGPTADPPVFHIKNRRPQALHVTAFPARLTFHVSLNVVHQGLDGIGEVPGVLLNADLDQVPATDCTLLFLFELWSRKETGSFEKWCHKGLCPITRFQSSES